MKITYDIRFDAAMSLPTVYGGRLHGHGYTLRVTLTGTTQADGMLIDFDTVKKILHDNIHAKVDHRNLNELLPLPSVEHLVIWIWHELSPHLPLAELQLFDTPHSSALLRAGDPETLSKTV